MYRRYRLPRLPTAAKSGDPFWRTITGQAPPSPAERSRLLREGEIVAHELVPWGSNYTFLVALAGDDGAPRVAGIYKPRQGEAPLWDFPDGTLYKREYAAYLLSRWLGWDFIAETIVRDGPYGVGSVQAYVESEDDSHYFKLRDGHAAALQRIALFDLIANNADRKAGHLFKGLDGKVYGIDHGLTFNTHPKLRTVIWDFAGEPMPEALLAPLDARFADARAVADLRAQLAPLLDRGEIERFLARAERVLEKRTFPGFNPNRPHSVPWGFV
ncbi:MAG TPA: SCO1664 family protein [Thermomicrobiales bacterium]|nr:SCO1664 family protein [Thermomicrobiales bacterium]